MFVTFHTACIFSYNFPADFEELEIFRQFFVNFFYLDSLNIRGVAAFDYVTVKVGFICGFAARCV